MPPFSWHEWFELAMEDIITTLSHLDPLWIYVAVFSISYIENIFPPFPSDVIVVFAGSLIAIDQGNAILTVTLATAGSTLGFMSMYWLGDQFGDRILEKGRIPFISVELVHKVQSWFKKYGYWVVIGNRFLAGTRAVISFCAGIAEMKLSVTTFLSAASALVWNSILIYIGYLVGDNWRDIGEYLATYSKIVSLLIAVIIIAWALVKWISARRAASKLPKI
jgi:membrane protein DedA with SNARE-associated domain